MGRRGSALALFVLAPFVGECLLGNLPISAVAGLLVLAPLYGGGALVVRETTRRLGAGWPTTIALAAAYALVEEALVDQMVFTPKHLDLGTFAGYAPIPGLDTSASLLVASLTMHTVWSICVPIALVEALSTEPHEPWLRWPGSTFVVLLFVAACVVLGDDQAIEMGFRASGLQYGTATVAVVVLVVVGVLLARRRPRKVVGDPPARVGLAAFAATSAYWVLWIALSGNVALQWLTVVLWLALAGLVGWLLLRWSRRTGWSERHVLAVAAGALLTYVWVCPVQQVSLGVPVPLVALGWLVYAGTALVVLARARRAERRRRWGSNPGPAAITREGVR